MKPLNIVFLGSGAFGLPTLQHLFAHHNILAVISQPDKPAGRGRSLTPTPIAEWTAANAPQTALLKPDNINTPDHLAAARSFKVDAWVVIAFGQKLSQPLLDGLFAINLHASLLPRWRGAAPINAAMLHGDTVTGNSVITLADRMDAGLILGQSRRPIDPLTTAGELHDLLSADGPMLVEHVLREFQANQLKPITQDESLVTKARKLAKADGILDFNRPAHQLRCQVHGLTPWPGITINLAQQDLKILRVAEGPPTHATPGTLIDPAAGLLVCGQSTTLKLLEVQPAGGKPMPWSSFARGRNTLTPGLQASTPSHLAT